MAIHKIATIYLALLFVTVQSTLLGIHTHTHTHISIVSLCKIVPCNNQMTYYSYCIHYSHGAHEEAELGFGSHHIAGNWQLCIRTRTFYYLPLSIPQSPPPLFTTVLIFRVTLCFAVTFTLTPTSV